MSGVAYANNTLVLADSSRVPAYPQNNRVFVYRELIASKLPVRRPQFPDTYDRCPVCAAEADVVLGQPDFAKTDLGLAQNGYVHLRRLPPTGRSSL